MNLQITNDFDKKLNEFYATKVTVNLEDEKTINPNEFWNSMELIAVNHKAMINFRVNR